MIDVVYSCVPSEDSIVWLNTNISINDTGINDYLSIGFTIDTYADIQYGICLCSKDGIEFSRKKFVMGTMADAMCNIRIFIFDEFVSVYINDVWVSTNVLQTVFYQSEIEATLSVVGASIGLTNVVRSELADRREAVFADYEATTENVIQSIIQQRPIEYGPSVDRALEFTYTGTKDEVLAHHIRSWSETKEDNSGLSSDGIVYYEDVGIVIHPDTAEDVGFIVRMYRLSELDSGALKAANTYQTLAYQRRNIVTVVMRFDPRIEKRDILTLSAVASGTERIITDAIIVENMSIDIVEGSSKMNILGRRQ